MGTIEALLALTLSDRMNDDAKTASPSSPEADAMRKQLRAKLTGKTTSP